MYVINFQDQSFEYARLNDATKRADKLAGEGHEIVVMHAETEAAVYAVNPRALAIKGGGYFYPWTRVETPKFVAPALTGWVPAYTRKRIQATVYRRQEGKGWLVVDGRTGGRQEVANTVEACELTKAMRHGLLLPA
jgi:hypothetical protein